MVLDRYLWIDLDQLSPLAEGDTTDGLKGSLDQVGLVPRPNGIYEPVRLTKVTRDGNSWWAFAPSVVRQVDTWYSDLGDNWIRELFPEPLRRTGPAAGAVVSVAGAARPGPAHRPRRHRRAAHSSPWRCRQSFAARRARGTTTSCPSSARRCSCSALPSLSRRSPRGSSSTPSSRASSAAWSRPPSPHRSSGRSSAPSVSSRPASSPRPGPRSAPTCCRSRRSVAVSPRCSSAFSGSRRCCRSSTSRSGRCSPALASAVSRSRSAHRRRWRTSSAPSRS